MRLAQWIVQIGDDAQAGERDRFRLDLVLTEVVTNTLTHGLAGRNDSLLVLEATLTGSVLEVVVIDHGQPFDPLTAPIRPLPTTLAEAVPGGLGLTLIRNYTDDTRYERRDEQNRLTLVFHLGAPPRTPA